MALTVVAIQDRQRLTNRTLVTARLNMDSSYPTGGEALTANLLTLGTITSVVSVRNDGGGYVPQYDDDTGKILMFEAGADAAALDEVTDTTDLSAQDVIVTVIGR